jgi:alkaline phosphatase
MATGVKNNDNTVALDSQGKRLTSIVELAYELGKKTGVITSVNFCHATPATFLAHSKNRYEYEKIARQIILESTADVIMGCGHPYYDRSGHPVEESNFRYVGDQETWEALLRGDINTDADLDGLTDPWTVIETAEGFRSLIDGPAPSRVFGIAPIYRTLQQERDGDGQADPFFSPYSQSLFFGFLSSADTIFPRAKVASYPGLVNPVFRTETIDS